MSRPIHQIRIGRIRAAIWSNEGDTGTWYNVTFERSYREGDDWKSSDSFSRDDLLVLAKLADMVHSWIVEATQLQHNTSELDPPVPGR